MLNNKLSNHRMLSNINNDSTGQALAYSLTLRKLHDVFGYPPEARPASFCFSFFSLAPFFFYFFLPFYCLECVLWLAFVCLRDRKSVV